MLLEEISSDAVEKAICEALSKTVRLEMRFTVDGNSFTMYAKSIKDAQAFATMLDRIFDGVHKKVAEKLKAEGWTKPQKAGK